MILTMICGIGAAVVVLMILFAPFVLSGRVSEREERNGRQD